MKKILFIIFTILTIFSCDGMLENIIIPTEPDGVNPYTVGNNYTVSIIQQHNKSFHVQIKDEERLLLDRYFGEFLDPLQKIKVATVDLVLPNETKTYTIYEEYSDEEISLNISPQKGKFITITYLSNGIFAQQSITPPQTEDLSIIKQ